MTAILHESRPVRYWDHDLGPDQLRLFAVDPDLLGEAAGPGEEFTGLRDLTPEPGRALDEQAFELTPDGTSVITGWQLWHPAGQSHAELVMIDVATGKRRVLLSAPEYDFQAPARLARRAVHRLPARDADHPGTPAATSPWSCWASTARARTGKPAATCCPAWTGGPSSPPGRPIPGPCTSPPTTAAGGRCSASTRAPARSPG